ncbi:MAG TPA: DUF6265 family protein [Cyclobacteriaceae bacterium]|nr:DUF6265 family protein [Cyclobacteriaceae bacterium]
MKKIVPFLVFVLSHTTAFGQAPLKNAEADFKKLSWLEGAWTRTNSKPGRTGIEEWRHSGDHELIGRGITLKGADTAFVEKLKIVVKDNTLYYVADVPENKSVVYFKFTELTGNSFVCENPSHDFPKKIAYKLDGSKLTAVISGGDKSIPYTFERK